MIGHIETRPCPLKGLGPIVLLQYLGRMVQKNKLKYHHGMEVDQNFQCTLVEFAETLS